MKRLITSLLLLWTIQAFSQKQVVITIDDLISNGPFRDLSHIQQVNHQVIDTASYYGVPAIGFVNEKKLLKKGQEKERTQILRDWLEGGLELGNHTYSHPSLFKTPLDEFKEEVIRGEQVTKRLLKETGMKMKYFRHPFLNTGPDSTTKAQFEVFLAKHHYTVAPVTVESGDYVFNKLYAKAVLENDTAQMKSVGQQYVEHTLHMFDWFEEVSEKVVGRPIPHIYLCHVNPLNADYLGAIYAGLQAKGYEFITLDQALKDPAYSKTDYFTGAWGMSWLYRWDEGKVKEWLMAEPPIDPEILKQYNE